jgi:hypothetical protein
MIRRSFPVSTYNSAKPSLLNTPTGGIQITPTPKFPGDYTTAVKFRHPIMSQRLAAVRLETCRLAVVDFRPVLIPGYSHAPTSQQFV